MKTLAQAEEWVNANVPVPMFPDPIWTPALVGGVAIDGVGTDIDILFICSNRADSEQYWVDKGFVVEGVEGDYPPDEFVSLRNGDINILLTEDVDFFNKWIRSVEVCKFVKEAYGSCDRESRVRIHQLIMDDIS